MITQKEFDHLISLEKEFKDNDQITLGSSWQKEIIAVNSKDTFILDYAARRSVNSIEVKRFTYNKRYRTAIILLRFDSCGRHTNPDGEILDGPHIHIYREGYADQFAFCVSKIGIDETDLSKENVLRKILNTVI